MKVTSACLATLALVLRTENAFAEEITAFQSMAQSLDDDHHSRGRNLRMYLMENYKKNPYAKTSPLKPVKKPTHISPYKPKDYDYENYDYYEEDYYSDNYYVGKKGKKGGKKGGGKKGGGGGGRKGRGKEKVLKLAVPFFQGPFTDLVGTSTEIGAQFLWDSEILDDEVEPIGSISGSAVRLLLANGTDPGFGHCTFTYTDDDANTVTAQGDLVDELGATLAITGGTNEFMGAFGQVKLTPEYNPNATGTDIFDDVDFYVGTLYIYVPYYAHYHMKPKHKPSMH